MIVNKTFIKIYTSKNNFKITESVKKLEKTRKIKLDKYLDQNNQIFVLLVVLLLLAIINIFNL